MAMNSDAAPKHGGSGGGELERRMTGVETRLSVIEKTMVTAEVFERELGVLRTEIGGLRGDVRADLEALRGEMRVELAKVPFETVKWLLAVSGIAAALATTVYNIWFR
jgi:hypothetical protein